MTVATLVMTAALANWAAIEAWRHGSIFDRQRAYLDACDPAFIVSLLRCPYCLSHWTGALFTFVLLACNNPYRPWWEWFTLPVLALAVTRISNVLNDVLHSRCRTPKGLPAAEMAELQAIADLEVGGV